MSEQENKLPGMPGPELSAPSHEDAPVPQPSAPVAKVGLLESKGVEVIATRPGFIYQQRYKKGDRFSLKKGSEIGEWMKCIDPSFEKEREKYFKKKKARD